MKVINSNNVIDNIRDALLKDCENCSLDDDKDFETVMYTIADVIDKWMVNRCEGCRCK